MTELSAPSPRRGTRTFRAAWIVLASVAAAQAASTALSTRITEQVATQGLVPPGPVSPSVQRKATDPFSPSWSGADDPHPEMMRPAGDPPPNDPALAMLKPTAVPSVARRTAPLDVPITDEEVLSHLDEGINLRSQSDMQGAVTHFRAALNKIPEHPKLLYHTAQTLDLMGQPQKAMVLWKTLYQLGKGAGDFYIFAQERIADGPQVNEPEEEKEGKFTIKDLREQEVPDSSGSQRVRFTAVLKKNTKESVDIAKDMILAIHFFDTVNGRHIARSQVQQPELSCISEPLNWAEGTETFTFEYWQPDMTPAQLVKYGRCKYFGCALEVFYKDKLQDSDATTNPVLLKMAREVPLPPPEPSNSLLDAVPAPVSGPQPESSLFPPVLNR